MQKRHWQLNCSGNIVQENRFSEKRGNTRSQQSTRALFHKFCTCGQFRSGRFGLGEELKINSAHELTNQTPSVTPPSEPSHSAQCDRQCVVGNRQKYSTTVPRATRSRGVGRGKCLPDLHDQGKWSCKSCQDTGTRNRVSETPLS